MSSSNYFDVRLGLIYSFDGYHPKEPAKTHYANGAGTHGSKKQGAGFASFGGRRRSRSESLMPERGPTASIGSSVTIGDRRERDWELSDDRGSGGSFASSKKPKR